MKSIISQSYWRYFGGQFWVGGVYWYGAPAPASFFIDVMGLDIGRELELKARAYWACVSAACWWWPHRDFVIVSERPAVIEKRPDGRLAMARWNWTDATGNAHTWACNADGEIKGEH